MFGHKEHPVKLHCLEDNRKHESPNGTPHLSRCLDHLRSQQSHDYEMEEEPALPEGGFQHTPARQPVGEHPDERRQIEKGKDEFPRENEALSSSDRPECHTKGDGENEDLDCVVDKNVKPSDTLRREELPPVGEHVIP